jgi:hypothetical protein
VLPVVVAAEIIADTGTLAPDAATEAHALAATRAGGVGVGVGVGVEDLIDGGYHEHDSLAGIIIGCAAAREHTFSRRDRRTRGRALDRFQLRPKGLVQ